MDSSRTTRNDAYKAVRGLVEELRNVMLFDAEADSILWAAEGLLLANCPTDAAVVEARTTFDTLMLSLVTKRWQDNGPTTAASQRKRLVEAFAECAPLETVAAARRPQSKPDPRAQVTGAAHYSDELVVVVGDQLDHRNFLARRLISAGVTRVHLGRPSAPGTAPCPPNVGPGRHLACLVVSCPVCGGVDRKPIAPGLWRLAITPLWLTLAVCLPSAASLTALFKQAAVARLAALGAPPLLHLGHRPQ